MFRVAFQTLGCKTNHYESSSLAQRFSEAGFEVVGPQDQADLYILNSCTVTHEAGRKCEQQLRRYKRNYPQAKIAVMGCHSQLKDLSDLADFTRGVSGRLDLLEWAKSLRGHDQSPASTANGCQSKTRVSRAAQYESLGILSQGTGTRSEIKIQDGCEMYCSYCAICLARGKVRSRPRPEIIAEAQGLADQGVKEIVLTGIHLCSFEKDLGRDTLALVELIEELSQISGVERIRLGSLEPNHLTDTVIDRLGQQTKLCPHFHLSLQSGSAATLKRMRRTYTPDQYASRVNRLRQVFDQPAITTDVMVAFPLESDIDHRESMDFIRDLQLSRLHIFRYSPRDLTPAAKLPQVDPQTSKLRSQEAQKLDEFLQHKFLVQNFDRQLEVLLEELDDGSWLGYSQNYIRCRLKAQPGQNYSQGQLIAVKPIDILDQDLLVLPTP